MIKIGEMAKLCNVSIQTLRYYDRLGILCADYVDHESGYRYYEENKIKLYNDILKLKQLKFSLEEIKIFLNSTEYEKLSLYAEKKQELQENLRMTNEKIRELDSACIRFLPNAKPLDRKILEIPFEDDPAAIGRWEYCGSHAPEASFCGTEDLEKKDILLKTLFFLPGGENVWMYLWSKNILYQCLWEQNLLIPNRYKIFTHQGKTYMQLFWEVDTLLKLQENGIVHVYQQVDNRAYGKRDTHLFRDETNLPAYPDARVLGHWDVFDVIDSPNDFSPHENEKNRKIFFIRGIDFYERGMCYKQMSSDTHFYQRAYRYTKGCVIKENECCVEHYELRTVGNKEYLILEHKSGDYIYLGKVFCYYVFWRNLK